MIASIRSGSTEVSIEAGLWPARRCGAYRRERLAEIDKDTVVMPTRLIFSQFADLWLRDYAATHVRARTLRAILGYDPPRIHTRIRSGPAAVAYRCARQGGAG